MATVIFNEQEAYFGACSECGHQEYRNILNGQWGFCPAHRIMWSFGENLFSSWMDESIEDQLKTVNELDGYQVIEDGKPVGMFSAASAEPLIEKCFRGKNTAQDPASSEGVEE